MSPEDEPDWESPEPDPPSLGPDIPSVEIPEVETAPGEVDPEVAGLFWRLVVVLDVAFLALALGPMLVYFEGNWRRGIVLAVFGLAALAYGVVRYRGYRSDDPKG